LKHLSKFKTGLLVTCDDQTFPSFGLSGSFCLELDRQTDRQTCSNVECCRPENGRLVDDFHLIGHYTVTVLRPTNSRLAE